MPGVGNNCGPLAALCTMGIFGGDRVRTLLWELRQKSWADLRLWWLQYGVQVGLPAVAVRPHLEVHLQEALQDLSEPGTLVGTGLFILVALPLPEFEVWVDQGGCGGMCMPPHPCTAVWEASRAASC